MPISAGKPYTAHLWDGTTSSSTQLTLTRKPSPAAIAFNPRLLSSPAQVDNGSAQA
ncbi:MAG TPA: hypothetical protein VFV92_13765 [Candidatus Bathyarchaeia archaeon]|nr:hypothetical protein [Candidatus Bathyarchaeia archaeon]